MHAQNLPASRAGPFLVLNFEKIIDSFRCDMDQIGNRAGAVLGPIALIQLLHQRAGEFGAIVAVARAARSEPPAVF